VALKNDAHFFYYLVLVGSEYKNSEKSKEHTNTAILSLEVMSHILVAKWYMGHSTAYPPFLYIRLLGFHRKGKVLFKI
jgi:hypothetical protein